MATKKQRNTLIQLAENIGHALAVLDQWKHPLGVTPDRLSEAESRLADSKNDIMELMK